MKKLWQVCVTTTAEAEEATIEALAAEFGVPASCYTDFETHVAQVSAYLDAKPANLAPALKSIRARLQMARQGGLRIGAVTPRFPLRSSNPKEGP